MDSVFKSMIKLTPTTRYVITLINELTIKDKIHEARRTEIVFMENSVKRDMYNHGTKQGIIDMLEFCIDHTKEIGEDSLKILYK